MTTGSRYPRLAAGRPFMLMLHVAISPSCDAYGCSYTGVSLNSAIKNTAHTYLESQGKFAKSVASSFYRSNRLHPSHIAPASGVGGVSTGLGRYRRPRLKAGLRAQRVAEGAKVSP